MKQTKDDIDDMLMITFDALIRQMDKARRAKDAANLNLYAQLVREAWDDILAVNTKDE